MLLHITPKLLTAHAFSTAGLASVEIPEFRLKLSGEKELMTRKPFSNKRYNVGCRRSGKASSGFLLELPHTVDEYTVISEWETVSGLHTHTVRYVVLDNELDAASDEMLLWPGDGAIFSDRCPEYVKSLTPVNYAPLMEMHRGTYRGECHDIYGPGGIIMERKQSFRIPTIERERLTLDVGFNLPSPDTAFVLS